MTWGETVVWWVCLVSLWGASMILLRRSLQLLKELRGDLEIVAEVQSGHSDKIAALSGVVMGLPKLLHQQAEAARPPAPWLGVVLPTDQTNAEVERRLHLAEDHAMSSQDLRPGSSPPSRRLGRT